MTIKPPRPLIDITTVAAIAVMAYILGTALHEYAGHGLACAALGGRVRELNAFYVDCDYQNIGDMAIRLIALAGPFASLLTGIIAFSLLPRARNAVAPLRLWLWLLGSVGLMMATGYLLFSAVLGLGDLGTTRDGALYELQPEWLWRVGVGLVGLAGYAAAIWKSVQGMEAIIGGSGPERVSRAQKIALTSYLAGGLASIVAGLPNPHGLVIILISAVAASLGGTSGLAWEMTLMRRDRDTGQVPLRLERDWRWIAAGLVTLLLYTLLLGPSLKL